MKSGTHVMPGRTHPDLESTVSGVAVYRTAEGASITESTPALRFVTLKARKTAAYSKASNELLEDSATPISDFIFGLFRDALSYDMDSQFLFGSGGNEALGVLNSNNNALIAVTRDTSNRINWEDIIAMWHRMAPGSRRDATWVISDDAINEVYQMFVAAGLSGISYFADLDRARVIENMLGRPVVWTERLNALGTQGDIALIDFSQYDVGIRSQSFAVSAEQLFQNDQTAFRATLRVDGQPLWETTERGRSDNDYSPYVVLATYRGEP